LRSYRQFPSFLDILQVTVLESNNMVRPSTLTLRQEVIVPSKGRFHSFSSIKNRKQIKKGCSPKGRALSSGEDAGMLHLPEGRGYGF
jgi:hypothetical protein